MTYEITGYTLTFILSLKGRGEEKKGFEAKGNTIIYKESCNKVVF
jgi:hypothetical protein